MRAGQADPSLANFSISHDTAYILPILQQARQLNPATTIMATPWSPPGWMKSSGSSASWLQPGATRPPKLPGEVLQALGKMQFR